MGWRKGQSGNPGGRPKARIDLQALARQRTPEAVATLVRIMRNKTNLMAAKGRRRGTAGIRVWATAKCVVVRHRAG